MLTSFYSSSNAGSQAIINTALEFWARGQEREEMTMKVIEPLISKRAYNEIGIHLLYHYDFAYN